MKLGKPWCKFSYIAFCLYLLKDFSMCVIILVIMDMKMFKKCWHERRIFWNHRMGVWRHRQSTSGIVHTDFCSVLGKYFSCILYIIASILLNLWIGSSELLWKSENWFLMWFLSLLFPITIYQFSYMYVYG